MQKIIGTTSLLLGLASTLLIVPPIYGQETTVTPVPIPTTAPPAKPKRHLQFGIEAGVFIPSHGKFRNRFGGTRFGIGPALGALRQCDVRGRFGYDFKLYYQKSGDNYAVWAPVGIEYRRALLDNQKVRPYAGTSIDFVPNLLRSDPDNVRGRLRAAYGGSVFLGCMFGPRRYIEARYTEVSRVQGFDMSGLSLGAGIRF